MTRSQPLRCTYALVVLSCLIIASVASAPASSAARTRHFAHPGACGTRESDSPKDFLTARVGIGRWEAEPQNTVRLVPFRKACVSDYLAENEIAWKGDLRAFHASYRWYIGKKLAKKHSGVVRDHHRYGPTGRGAFSKLASSSLRYVDGRWTIHRHPVSVKVRLSKKGYASVSYRITNFIDDLD